jgi:hypothetical protein
MALGTSLFLVAVGAILRFAVADAVNGVDLSTIGIILIVVGVIGAILSLITTTLMTHGRRGGVVEERRVVERDPYA